MSSEYSRLQCARFDLNLSSPKVMGIVNVTPDSFSDGGQYVTTEAAVAHALRLVEEGADILDIGGESTRPNALPVTVEQEIARVMPVLEALVPKVNIPISLDTSSPELMRLGIAAGASIINDVRAFTKAGAIEAVAHADVGVIIMHMLAEPSHMQNDPRYDDVVMDITEYLLERAAVLQKAGVAKNRICIDPGVGFGKTTEHDCQIMHDLQRFSATGYPVLCGTSRKKFLGKLTNEPVANKRVAASVATAVISVLKGANIVRVHDVAQTVAALKVTLAISQAHCQEVAYV